MKRAVVIIVLVLAGTARAHIGSPDVFFEGDAGPYELFVTVRVPKVIPGIAEIEIRSATPDVHELSVVPMRLTGPGSELPPTPDRATRSAADPQFFTASLWLMERGSLQVRIAASGTRGPGTLAVPVPAVARTTLAMPRGLGTLLFALMIVLALAIVAIVVGALREATLAAGEPPRPRATRVLVIASAFVVAALALGNHWWTAVARGYGEMTDKPWKIDPIVRGCTLTVPHVPAPLLSDHGHDMHLFLVNDGRLAHLHPAQSGDDFVQQLPALPAGHYRLYADIVMTSGLPSTGTAELDLADLAQCGPPAGDDSTWASGDVAHIAWDRPAELRAGVALPLAFRVEPADGLEPYMGMVAHVEIVKTDGSVFAHLHPNGSVAMPALALAHDAMNMSMDPRFTIPFGFPQPGDYRIFVQIKRHGAVETAAFDAHVDARR